MNANASEQDIFRATTGHATHWNGDAPAIWKTGSELCAQLRIAARTANRHFKELAALGYWEIGYRPRPGSIGKVTRLTMTARSLDLVALARQQSVARATGKSRKVTSSGTTASPPDATAIADPSVHDVTSKQVHQSEKTAKNGKGFVLPSEAEKKGMKETCPSGHSGKDKEGTPKALGYLKACVADHAFAAIVREVWTAAGLKEWDWSSRFTWEHIAEIRKKAAKIGIAENDTIEIVQALIGNWDWLRFCMAPR